MLNGPDSKIIQEAVHHRRNFVVGFPHILCFLVDPKYCGLGLEINERRAAEDYFCNGKSVEEKEKAYKELNAYLEYCQCLGFFLLYSHVKKN